MFRAHVYYSVSGIITLIGGRPVHNLCSMHLPGTSGGVNVPFA